MSISRHRLGIIVAVLYFVALAAVVLWPTPVDRPFDGNLTDFLRWLRSLSIPHWISTFTTVEFTANIVMFVPFGIIVAVPLAHRFWWVAVPAGAALSSLIELTQGFLLPERVADWRDIVANTSGALLGALGVCLFRVVRPKPLLRVPLRELPD
ncbi:VanZ family protein [Arthrobacter sp. GMC3]|uniref:VanZ family protein n=1 Tax=Arthrobacter sp. GMC3 TaxID=2058894 RepID=UPI0015E3F0F8|nr:VanZ family protein [Arthrobacter sp. GMC3]